ncbi:MAG: hypothetical protein P4K93_15490 [Terracidiphilus sp.]|nr:hypothetical protein [Terracidiphilus sp.]
MSNTPGNLPPQGYPPYPPQQYPPPYPPGVYPPPKKGPSALKIVLIIVAIVVGLGIIGVGIVGYGVYRLAKSGHITTSTQPVTAGDLGVALYPGAEQQGNVRATVLGKDVLTATFLTSDAKDQVVAFYQNALGPKVQASSSTNGESFILNKGAGESVIVTVTQSALRSEGKTQIVVVHTTQAEATSTPGTQGATTINQ